MSFIAPPQNLYEIIFEVKTNGYIPIIAHPERYAFFHNSFVDYYKLKKHGCLFQINLLSTTGYYGNRVLKITEKPKKKGLNFRSTNQNSFLVLVEQVFWFWSIFWFC